MRFDWWTLALQTVNFAVLVWLLHRFLYKPVLRIIATRQAEVERQYAEARKAEAEAKASRVEAEAARAGIAAERDAALKAATARADERARARSAQAEQEADALLAEARKSLAAERAAALAEVRDAALDLGEGIARRLLAEVPPDPSADGWLERVERQLGQLPKAEIEALTGQLGADGALKVVTASPLPLETAARWRERLRRPLGDRIAVSFDVDPAILAGVELHFPSAVLRFSWQSAVAALRAELEAGGNAG
jgi:F-type H+-transporting ATPase subunit b